MVDPPYRIKNMMPGMIMLWYGSVASIPSGWHECDGTVGTPDLRERFVIGMKVGGTPQSTGGTLTHDHDFTGDGHAHNLVSGPDIIDSAPAGDYSHGTSVQPAAGETDSGLNMPPYMRLCFIMKL